MDENNENQDEEISKDVLAFVDELLKLNQTLVEIFRTGNVELFTKLNQIIRTMYAIQHDSEESALVAVEEDCQIIYQNFDMIVSVLRTTEEGEIDQGAQTALNKFLHNINEASINIAAMYGLIQI